MSQERDSHFQGFAKTLWDELMTVTDGYIDVSSDGMDDEWIEQYKAIIARRAYDLACHVIYETSYGLDRFGIPERINENVPDLTEWPK